MVGTLCAASKGLEKIQNEKTNTHYILKRERWNWQVSNQRKNTLSFKYKPQKSIRKKMICHGIIFIQNKMTQKSTRDPFKQKKEKTKMDAHI